MYQGCESHREEPPPPPPGIPLASEVDEGGEIDFPLKKEEDEAEPSGGAPEPESKLEEKVVQEAEQEALPEAKPEDKQQPADPRKPPPARGEPLLTQKGPEANAATGGGTGCGCVPSHALSPFRTSGSDVALGRGSSALRVLRVLRVGFMRVPGDIQRGLHVSRVLQNGRLRCRMKMTRNGTRTRYSGDKQRSEQGRLLRGTHCAADHTHNRYNSTGRDDFVDKEWECEDVQNVADTKPKGDSGQWAIGSGQRTPAVCWYPLQCALWSGWLPRCEALPGWGPRPHNNPSPPSTTPCCAHPPQRGRPALAGGVGLSGAVVTWEAVHAVVGKAAVGAAGPRGGRRAAAAAGGGGMEGGNGRREGKVKGGKEVREPSAP